jgi:hypothetical protein
MRAFFGIVGLAAAGFVLSSVTTVGCGSDSKGGSGGSGGSGNTTGTAGTTGGGGTGGSGGSGGTTATLGCQTSAIAPGDPLIADFSASDGGMASLAIGGTFVYPMTGGPIATVTNGALHITATSTGMATAQYWGVGIFFNGDSAGTQCVDATAHTGVQFDISGTIGGTGCTAQYSTNDSAHSNNATDMKGAGDSTSYAPQAAVTASTTVATVMMPFSGTGAPSGGNPAVGVDKSKLTGVQWQFTTAAGTTNNCAVDLTIDNVKFY